MRVEAAPSGALAIHMCWGEPYGGDEQDVLYCPQPDKLVMDTTMRMHSGTVLQHRTIFNRRR